MTWLKLIDPLDREILVNMDHVIKVEPRQMGDRRVGSKLVTSTVKPDGKPVEVDVANNPETIALALDARGADRSTSDLTGLGRPNPPGDLTEGS